jgi:hypothetical protein
MRTSRWIVSTALVLGVVASAGSARADDTVFLVGGGRVRGTIMAEEPGKGVTIRLADGTTRVIKAAEVQRVQYEEKEAPAAAPAPAPLPAPAPAPGPVAAPYGPPPAYMVPPPPMASTSSGTHRRKGLLATGIVFLSAGVIAMPCGGAALAASHHANYNYGYYSDDKDLRAAGDGLLIGGGIAIATGLPLFIVGLVKVKNRPESESRSDEQRPAPRPAVSWSVAPTMAGRSSFGLGIVGAM